jgi:hypothetical protein
MERLNDVSPSSRIATQIHHRRNQNLTRSNLIKDSERKAVGSTPSRLHSHGMPGAWKSQDSVDRAVNLVEKSGAESALLLFVVMGCFS